MLNRGQKHIGLDENKEIILKGEYTYALIYEENFLKNYLICESVIKLSWCTILEVAGALFSSEG